MSFSFSEIAMGRNVPEQGASLNYLAGNGNENGNTVRYWRSDCAAPMFSPVRRHLFKPLVYLLVAAQLLLAVPAMAYSRAQSGTSAPCDQMTHMADTQECPCCPDGGMSMSDCLVSCTLASAAAPVRIDQVRVAAPAQRVDAMPSDAYTSYSAPPLKPPPIG
jgi:hypothetical protein